MSKLTYRDNSLSGIKFFIATSSFAGMLGLWSLFANQERLTQLQMPEDQVYEQGQSSSQLVNTLPTLIALQLPDGQSIQIAEPTPELRSVSAPPALRTSSNPTVVSNSGGGGSSNNIVTSTSSSG